MTGIQRGNEGIDPGTWTETPASADGANAPLPGYPLVGDMPQVPDWCVGSVVEGLMAKFGGGDAR